MVSICHLAHFVSSGQIFLTFSMLFMYFYAIRGDKYAGWHTWTEDGLVKLTGESTVLGTLRIIWSKKGATTTRILVAFEKEYRAYRDVISAGIQALRPKTEVATVELEDLERDLEIFDPHLVICGSPNRTEQSRWDIPWIELSMDPTGQTKVYIDGNVSEHTNPTLDAMLMVIDGLEGRPQATPKNRFDESTA